MSIRKRLVNVARAELKSAGKKLGGLFEGSGDDEDEKRVEEELERMEREDKRSGARASSDHTRPSSNTARSSAGADRTTGEPPHIRKYYANLELPIGAPLSEVKASYRRLMRRYHPDLHRDSAEQTQLATRLAQELRVAYDGLVAYLEPRDSAR